MANRLTGMVDTEDRVNLHRRAVEKYSASKTANPIMTSPEAIQKLLHELQVHQIELEMQNEELLRAQAELDASQARYFDLYDLAPVGYLTLSDKKIISMVNLTAASMFGIARSALFKVPISRILPSEEQIVFYQQLKRCHESGSPQDWDMRMVRADDSIFWAHLQAVAAQNGEYWITLSDITERKLVEDALKVSELRHRTILHTALDGFWLVDRKGQLREVNESYCRMSGYSEQELLAMRISDLEAIESADDTAARILKITTLGEDRFESCHRRKDGTLFAVEIGVQCQSGEDDLMVVFLHDITARKLAEEDKAKLVAQLQQAQKIEAIGRLAGGVAHDFNNMLGVIMGYTEMAQMKLDPSQPLYADLEEIGKAAERSAALTRQLLAFARKQTIEPKVLDLNVVVAGMLKMLQRLIGENVEISWLPGAALWQVLADPSQIDQMLANLCVNVRDAIADVGKATIETGNSVLDEVWCGTHFGSVPGEYVRISVKDNGSGMDNEVLEHLFEPFFTTKDTGKGTGLGLATVYGAVKQNNGILTVDSKTEEGTTFTIYLPRHLGNISQDRSKTAAMPTKGKNETILLVEDEVTVLEMTRAMLAMQGYTVLTATSPGIAFCLAREYSGKIDLLMTDVIMPEMNGRDLAGKLLTLYPDLKSLFMSGYTGDFVSHHGVLGKGISFIQKPFSLQGLTANVREVLDRT